MIITKGDSGNLCYAKRTSDTTPRPVGGAPGLPAVREAAMAARDNETVRTVRCETVRAPCRNGVGRLACARRFNHAETSRYLCVRPDVAFCGGRRGNAVGHKHDAAARRASVGRGRGDRNSVHSDDGGGGSGPETSNISRCTHYIIIG